MGTGDAKASSLKEEDNKNEVGSVGGPAEEADEVQTAEEDKEEEVILRPLR
jgi:hypothetical protein